MLKEIGPMAALAKAFEEANKLFAEGLEEEKAAVKRMKQEKRENNLFVKFINKTILGR